MGSEVQSLSTGASAESLPLYSVVVPTCGREALRVCLDLIAPGSQTLPSQEYEVIVSDDSPTHPARSWVEAEYPWARWVAGPQRGPAANRNNGARSARGTWLVFLDDDCEPERSWLAALAEVAADPAVMVVEGKTICPDPSDNPFRERVENLKGEAFWSCNLAVRRDVFAELGGFDEDFTEAGGEDMELAWRLRSQQRVCRFAPAAVVCHPSRPIGWRKLWWRTFLMRWMLLYRMKTQQAPALQESALKVGAWLLRQQLIELVRGTGHLLTRFDRSAWRRRSFMQLWKWLTFPVVFPYLMVWEFRFRRVLSSRARRMDAL